VNKVWHVVPVRIKISFNVFNIYRPVENSISATVVYQHLLSFLILGETFLLVFYTSATVKAKKTTTGEHSSKWFEPRGYVMGSLIQLTIAEKPSTTTALVSNKENK